jgi:ADP-ribose pyrophosphatase YjhB (NUDIX family)
MNLYCNNCGKNGHAFHQCKSPITSYGIIAFRENPTNSKREYLLIRRKDTLGFVDFMRGKYSIYNKEYILNMINQMTNDEKTRLINEPFSKLWGDLWGTDLTKSSSYDSSLDESSGLGNGRFSSYHTENRSFSQTVNNRDRDPYKAEEQTSRNKFESLKLGVYTNNYYYNLEELILSTDKQWDEPEWGFPKGRRNYQEKDYDCAVREFCEETGYSVDKMVPLKNIQPFEEIFTGSNYKSYKHKYYITYMEYGDTLSSRHLQMSEVSESKWMSFEECYAAIRYYNLEKKRLLVAVEKMLSVNCLSHMNMY